MGRRTTAAYNKRSEELRRQISKNLSVEKKRVGKISMNRLSSACCASHGTVEAWFRGDAIPGLTNLYLLADYFGISVYNLLESDKDVSHYLSCRSPRLYTYADLFLYFKQMIESPYLHFQSSAQLTGMIADPIARFLVESFFRNLDLVKQGNVPGSELRKWVQKVSSDFDIPLSGASPRQVQEVFSSSRTFDEYADYQRTAACLHEQAAQMLSDAAQNREEAAAADGWNNPDFRTPSPSERAEFPEFYKDHVEYDVIGLEEGGSDDELLPELTD